MATFLKNIPLVAYGTGVTSVATGASSIVTGQAIIVVVFNTNQNNTVTSVTDTAGNTYTSTTKQTSSTGMIQYWYKMNATGNAANVITANFASGFNGGITAYVYSGVASNAVFDRIAGAGGGPGTNPASPATTATQNVNEIVVGSLMTLDTTPGNISAGAGYSGLSTVLATTVSLAVEQKIVGATGTQTATFTDGSSFQYLAAVATFTDQPIGVPVVTTQDVTLASLVGGTGNGNVTSDGGNTITERGIVYSRHVNPTTADTKVTAAGTTGAFTAAMTGLLEDTRYHVRAYATNSIGTSYGTDVSFITEVLDAYLLENGTDRYLLENGLGLYGIDRTYRNAKQYESDGITPVPIGASSTLGSANGINLQFDVRNGYDLQAYTQEGNKVTPKLEVETVATAFDGVASFTAPDLWTNTDEPLGLRSSFFCYDVTRKRFLMFGGAVGSTSHNEVWELRMTPKGKWRQLSPTGTPPTARYMGGAVFDATNNRMLTFAGFTTADTNDVFSLSFASNEDGAWTQLSPTGTAPLVRSNVGHTVVNDPTNNCFYVFGGWGASYYNSVNKFVYTTTAGVWSVIGAEGAAGAPGIRRNSLMTLDTAGNRLLVWGGAVSGTTFDTALYAFSLSGNTWSTLTTTGGPPAGRELHTGFLDPTSRKLWVWGGWQGAVANMQETLWVLDVATLVWTNKSFAAGYQPLATEGTITAYDPNTKLGVMWSGVDTTNDLQHHVLLLDPAETSPILYGLQMNHAPRPMDATIARANSDYSETLVVGGFGQIPDNTTIANGGHLTDTFEYDYGNNIWRVAGSGIKTFPHREGATLVYDSVRSRYILFGGLWGAGGTNIGTFNDCWEFKKNSNGDYDIRRMSPTGTPPGIRWQHAAAFDATANRMIITCGSNGGTANYNDVWELSFSGGTEGVWTQRTPTGTPPAAKWGGMHTHDIANRILYIGAGATAAGEGTYTNVFHKLDLSTTNTAWTALTNFPGAARRTGAFVLDPINNKIVSFGGWDNSVLYGDLYYYDIGGNSWSSDVALANEPSARRSHGSWFDPENYKIIITHGRPASGGTWFGDTFELTPDYNTTASSVWVDKQPIYYERASITATGLANSNNYHWQYWTDSWLPTSYGANLESATDFRLGAATSTFTRTHTTDALKRKQSTLTHTTDSLKRAQTTHTHTTDAFKRKQLTLTHTTDANKKKTTAVSHTTDANKKLTTLRTHTTDANKRVTGLTRTHTTDALKRKTNTLAHTTDALKRAQTTKTHTTDALKRVQTTKTHTTDALKRKQFTPSHTTDSLKRKQFTPFHTTDANKKKTGLTRFHTTDANKKVSGLTRPHTTDALKRTQNVKVHTTDALKRKTNTLTHTTDAFRRIQTTRSHTTDANKKKTTLVTHTTDANKKAAGLTRTHTTDTLKRKQFVLTHTTDSLKRTQNVKTHTTDAFKRIQVTKTHTTDAYLKKVFTKTHTADANKRKALTVSHTTDSNKKKSGLVRSHTTDANKRVTGLVRSHTTDTLKRSQNTRTHTTDALKRTQNTRTHTTDALKRIQVTRTHTTDANKKKTTLVSHTADANKRVTGLTRTHTTDALKRKQFVLTHTTDALKRAQTTKFHTTDANKKVTGFTRTHTTDAYLKKVFTKTHTTDANRKKATVASHTTDANKRVTGLTRTHTTDALKRVTGITRTHTTDALKRKQFTLSHTTDSLKRKTNTIVHTTDANKKKTTTRFHTTDANKKLSGITRVHTTDSLKRKAFTVTHTTDANKKKALSVTHTTDSLKRKQFTVTHTTDANKRVTGLTRTHTTDALKRKQNTVTHTTSANKRKALTVSHTADASKKKVPTLTHTTDAYLSLTATIGPSNPGTATDSGSGFDAWVNPGNVFTSNDAYATSGMGFNASFSNFLRVSNFGFSIPAGATINGIKVEIERKGNSTITDKSITLMKNLVSVGSDKADTVTTWPTSDAYATYGSTSDVWGTTWTVNDINNANFGVSIQAKETGGFNTASIDHVRISVTYTPGIPKVQHTTDANKRKAATVSHTTDTNKKVSGFTRSHTTDAWMVSLSTVGPLNPATTGNDSGVGTVDWATTGNIVSSDNTYATTGPNPFDTLSHYLKASNFGFSLPSTATVRGILVEIERHASANGVNYITDNAVKIVKADGTIGTVNKADTVTKWPTSDAYVSYGGLTDLWGLSWAYTDINDIDFGAVLAVNINFDTNVTAFVDHIRITVAYTVPTPSFTKNHTTDALKRKQLTLTHTTDANKKKTGTLSHTTDANKKKTSTVSHTTDALKRKQLTVAHTTDALKRKQNTRTHTTDAFLRRQITKTHTTDALLRRQITKTHTADANKRKALTLVHTTDANKKKAANALTHTTDALKRKQFTVSHTTDALKRTQNTKTHTTDALKRTQNVRTHTTDSNKRRAYTVSHTTDANKKLTAITRSHTTDSLLRRQLVRTHTTDAFKRRQLVLAHTTDALKRTQNTRTHTTDANKKRATTVLHTTDANKKRSTLVSHTTDTLKRKTNTVSHTTDANKKKATVRTHTTDAFLRKTNTRSHTTDANRRKALTASHTTDANKRKATTVFHTTDANKRVTGFTRTHTTDALKRRQLVLTHSTDTLLRRQLTRTHTTDAFKRTPNVLVHTTDTNKKRAYVVTHTTDSNKKKAANTRTHTTDALLRTQNIKTHSTDANKRLTTVKSHTTDALKRKAFTVSHTTDSNKRKATTRTHTTDANKRVTGIVRTHTTDAFKRTQNVKTHTTDALKRTQNTRSHTTDALKRRAVTVSHTTDANKRKALTVSHTTDTNKKKTLSVSHTTDANKRKTGLTRTHTTDALKRTQSVRTHTTDTLKRTQTVKSHTTDALLRKQNTRTHTTDANKRRATIVSHTTDSNKRRTGLVVSHTTDTNKRKAGLTRSHTTDSFLRKQNTRSHTTDSNKKRSYTVTHTTDTYRRGKNERNHSTDANKRLATLVSHTTDANKRKALSVSHTTDALKHAAVTRSHTTDTILRDTRFYTREQNNTLPTDAAPRAIGFTQQQVVDVGVDDNANYVDQFGAKYLLFYFERYAIHNRNEIHITWNGKSTIDTMTRPVYLELYNVTSGLWETLDSNNTTSGGTEFTLTGTKLTGLTNYYDASNKIVVRVYQ